MGLGVVVLASTLRTLGGDIITGFGRKGQGIHLGRQVGALSHGCFADYAHNTSRGFSSSTWRPRCDPPPLFLAPSRCCLGFWCHFRVQLLSLLLIQSPWLALSAALDRALMVCRCAWPRIPMSLRRLATDLPTKPLHPTSTGRTVAFHPRCSTSAASSAYQSFFRS